jgi:uncharacterized protein YcaQ
MPARRLSRARARRIALAAQGFGRLRPSGPVHRGHLRRLVERLGLVQLDFVTVLVPAHYQVPFSRLGPYDRRLLDDLAYRRRELTEQWAHEASLVPVESWPLLEHRRQAFVARPRGFATFLEAQPAYVRGVLEEVRRRGPLAAEDLPDAEGVPRRLEHSWFGTVQRAVLESLFGRGALAIARRRPDFSRLYDLSERVVPEEHHGRRVERPEAQRELLRRSARGHGVGTAADLADYWRMPVREARPRLAELVAAGELEEVTVEGWREAAFLHPEARQPRRIEATALLSPFDPLVWFRPRTARLFGFDYRFEIFIPAARRRWGSYVLPFLLGDELVARVDVKSERDAGLLRVRGAWLEAGARAEAVAPPLAAELAALAAWLGLGGVAAADRGDLAAPLAGALGSL